MGDIIVSGDIFVFHTLKKKGRKEGGGKGEKEEGRKGWEREERQEKKRKEGRSEREERRKGGRKERRRKKAIPVLAQEFELQGTEP
jgi:hypothetical protein